MEEKISLARLYYPVTVLGPGSRAGIWLTGCDRNCPGCISPELQRYDPGREVPISAIAEMIATIPGPVDGFTISGGEPFYRPAALNALTRALERISDDILIFTGYTLQELRSAKDPDIDQVLGRCAALIDGPFERELAGGRGLRGSSNQRCHVFRHAERYQDIETQECALQTIIYNDRLLTIGIPRGEKKA